MANQTTYEFDNTHELEKIIEDQIPEVERVNNVYAHHPDKEEPDNVFWRNAIYTDEDEPSLAGEVSSNEDWYHITQYSDVLQAPLDRLKDHEIDPSGHITLSDSRHRMTGKLGLGEDAAIEPFPGDVIDPEVHVRAGHSGALGIKYANGATREICSNGMTAFVAEQEYEQTHSEPFKPQLAYHAVDGILEGTEEVEQRLQEAQRKTLMNQDEALLLLRDFVGIDHLLEDPTPDLLTALDEEVEDMDNPSLYETFNAATYALEHMTSNDTPEHILDSARENAAELIEYGEGVPSARILGKRAVGSRANHLIESQEAEAEEYWEGETDAVRELMVEHEIEI